MESSPGVSRASEPSLMRAPNAASPGYGHEPAAGAVATDSDGPGPDRRRARAQLWPARWPLCDPRTQANRYARLRLPALVGVSRARSAARRYRARPPFPDDVLPRHDAPTGEQHCIVRCLERAPDRTRFLGKGALVVLPTMGRRSQRWLGDSREVTDSFAVFAALRIAGRVSVGPDTAENVTLSEAVRVEYVRTFSRVLATP